MIYDELLKRYLDQSAELGSQRSANLLLKKHNERLKEKVRRLEAQLLLSKDDSSPITIKFIKDAEQGL